MAFAAAFARPASSAFIRPGAASLWFPPRPFPASRWLAEHRPAGAARIAGPGGSAGSAGVSPARGQRYQQAREPAGTEAHPSGWRSGATGSARLRVAGEPPRLDLELRLLFSRYAPAPDEDFFTSLRIELGRRAWSLEHAIGAPRPAWSPAPGNEDDLDKLRARLVTDVNVGLAMVESAPIRYPRPVRNLLLARQAGLIGRCLHDLLAHPEAGSLGDELTRLLEALQRRSA